MRDGKSNKMGFAMAFLAVIAISTSSLADEGRVRIPGHNESFASGTVPTGQSRKASGKQVVNASEPHVDEPSRFIAKISGARTVRSAKVVLLPLNIKVAVEPSSLEVIDAIGCVVPTRDQSHIASLINLLRKANVRDPISEGAAYRKGHYAYNEKIYLTLANGEVVSFFFGLPSKLTGIVEGDFHAPHADTNLIADRSLPEKLYLWALESGGQPQRPFCDQRSIQESIKILEKWTQPTPNAEPAKNSNR